MHAKDFIRIINIETKKHPLTLQKILMEVNTGAWVKDPNLN